ncbi:MAG: type IV toxin-antitoxin system AbiEi family antitoxin domain-containing protein [Myxococcaceae bacterium]|nr:type IV toxin-antitoxin system AbiEi family antitoxin domain-containing protein [Myxococcaceae bacterium]
MKLHAFFERHRIFRREELVEAYEAEGKSPAAARAAIDYHVRRGALMRVRQGVYMRQDIPFDAWRLPQKLHPDAVLAYDAAASFYGMSELDHSFCYLAPRRIPHLWLGEIAFRAVVEPSVADVVSRFDFVRECTRDGQQVAVTTPELTIVDCCDRLDRAPPLEVLFDSLLSRDARPLDCDAVVAWALKRASPAGCARVGMLLSARPEAATLRKQLAALERRRPIETTYATQDRRPGGRYSARWHLTVPDALSKRVPMVY